MKRIFDVNSIELIRNFKKARAWLAEHDQVTRVESDQIQKLQAEPYEWLSQLHGSFREERWEIPGFVHRVEENRKAIAVIEEVSAERYRELKVMQCKAPFATKLALMCRGYG